MAPAEEGTDTNDPFEDDCAALEAFDDDALDEAEMFDIERMSFERGVCSASAVFMRCSIANIVPTADVGRAVTSSDCCRSCGLGDSEVDDDDDASAAGASEHGGLRGSLEK